MALPLFVCRGKRVKTLWGKNILCQQILYRRVIHITFSFTSHTMCPPVDSAWYTVEWRWRRCPLDEDDGENNGQQYENEAESPPEKKDFEALSKRARRQQPLPPLVLPNLPLYGSPTPPRRRRDIARHSPGVAVAEPRRSPTAAKQGPTEPAFEVRAVAPRHARRSTEARRVLGWPKRCQFAHAFPWQYRCKRL